MKRFNGRAACAGALAAGMLLCCTVAAADRGAPPTAKIDVVDKYDGDITVTDSYRWLEQNDDRTRAWSLAQDKRTRRYLDRLPHRKPMFQHLMKQAAATSSSYYALHAAGGKLFAMYNQPPKQQPMIALLSNAADPKEARVIVDPNAIDPKGTTAIDWFVPSPDGRHVAVSMSENGSEDGSLHVFEVASGKKLSEVIPRVQYPTGGGSLAWRADGSGFWYTQYPGPDRPAEEHHFYEKLYYHKLGDDLVKDVYVLGKDLPKVAEIFLDNRQNPNHTVVTVANGDGGEFAHYVIGPDDAVKQVTRFEDKVVAATVGPDGAMYLVSRKDAPRGRLLKLAPNDYDLARAKVIVPQSEAVLQGSGETNGAPVVVTKQAIYVSQLVGGPSRVAIFGHDGTPRGELPLPGAVNVDEIEPLADGTLLYSVRAYLNPPYFARYDEASGKALPTGLAQTSPVVFDDVVVVREFATSKDGTRIPLNIVRRKDLKLDGSNPVLLNAYGGYGVSMTPRYLGAATRLWLDAGGVFVVANLRGGGEFGEEWHQQGMLTRKQNVFDDFIASAEYLVKAGYTTPKRLAAIGGSNGGLLMGAAFTQRPDLFRAVVATVGIYDMLRVELDPNGAFNVTEFGSVKNPDEFKALFGYSPYHRVVDGTKYPAIFMATGETDGRVNPMHSRKMVARLQAATASGYPVLLSINAHAGHGIGSSLSIKINQTADIYSFLFDQLDMKLPKIERHRPAPDTKQANK
ncbi:MAG TPA: prolyl oligopeptidase family serine peptidase [Paucimonas sp.]|nr:prolyl oligopeptidase family serine peptidase [Paucimonas sp.]